MHGYFDTSLVLSILRKEPSHGQALRIWRECEARYSSLLLRIEATICMRRSILGSSRPDPDILEHKEMELREMLVETSLISMDERIAEIVGYEKTLTRCRSLDAIHLATALFVRRETGQPLTVCSYDARMRETARELGFAVLPK